MINLEQEKYNQIGIAVSEMGGMIRDLHRALFGLNAQSKATTNEDKVKDTMAKLLMKSSTRRRA